jgi:hypothetical protein
LSGGACETLGSGGRGGRPGGVDPGAAGAAPCAGAACALAAGEAAADCDADAFEGPGAVAGLVAQPPNPRPASNPPLPKPSAIPVPRNCLRSNSCAACIAWVSAFFVMWASPGLTRLCCGRICAASYGARSHAGRYQRAARAFRTSYACREPALPLVRRSTSRRNVAAYPACIRDG